MSADLVQQAFDACGQDNALNAADKLVLIRWAWKSRPGQPYEIKYKELARDLGLSRNGVKKAVRHLIELGYLYEVSVKVVPGPAFQRGHTVTPARSEHRGHSVTPEGSPRDPQKGHPVTPTQRKKKKGAVVQCPQRTLEWIRAGTGLSFDEWDAQQKGTPHVEHRNALGNRSEGERRNRMVRASER